MNYVELYIKALQDKQAQGQQTVPVPAKVYDLPGLKSYKQMEAVDIVKRKIEYNGALDRHQRLVQSHKAAKGEKRKELRQALASSNEHLTSLLQKIGAHTPSEKALGFEVPNA